MIYEACFDSRGRGWNEWEGELFLAGFNIANWAVFPGVALLGN